MFSSTIEAGRARLCWCPFATLRGGLYTALHGLHANRWPLAAGAVVRLGLHQKLCDDNSAEVAEEGSDDDMCAELAEID